MLTLHVQKLRLVDAFHQTFFVISNV